MTSGPSLLRVPMLATAFVAVVLIAWWAASWSAATRKLEGLTLAEPAGSYRIVLAFAPERFHQLRLQDEGRLVEVRDRTVSMRDVSPKAVRRIAGEYWVLSVSEWDGK